MASSQEFVNDVLEHVQETGIQQPKKNFSEKGNSVTRLSSLPNIGKEVEKQLMAVGIETIGQLKNIGSREAWLKIQKIDASACYNRLCALEGAILGIRWHDLSIENKASLKAFYLAHKLKDKE